jgi:hypothetical protein
MFSGRFRIRKIGDDWFLESSRFESFPDPAKVFPVADEILLSIHRMSVLFAYLLVIEHIKIGFIQEFDDLGVPRRRGLRGSDKINVYSGQGLEELKEPRGTQTTGSAIIEFASSNETVHQALSLITEIELGWPQLYNILEFLGGDNVIVSRKWATKSEVRRYRQTANHFRHLGSPKKYPLPPDPPSIGEGRKFILHNLLKKWVLTQL